MESFDIIEQSFQVNTVEKAIQVDTADLSTNTINDIRDIKSDEDIYELVHDNVKEVLKKEGKYKFREKPPKMLEMRPIYTYRDGNKYLGQWDPKTNKTEGQGILVFSNKGTLHEGYFKNGNFHGWGREIDNEGTVYIGQWIEGRLRGNSVVTFGTKSKLFGDKYVGCIKNN